MAEPPSKLLTLTGLPTRSLPAASASAAELTPLIAALLHEALPLLDSVTTAPSEWKSKGTKRLPASAAPIALSERVIIAGDGGGGGGGATTTTTTWACRRSVHADAARRGTAAWAEFARCLRDEHAATEDAFTPTVLAHREARAWGAAAGVGDAAPGIVVGGRRWGGFALALVEMKHRVPPPLRPRVFPVLQLVARAVPAGGPGQGRVDDDDDDDDEFVVVSVPVGDLAEHGGEEGLAVLSREKGVVVGAYAAVERVRRLPGAGEGVDGEVEWVMATASDARGVLPMWVQTKAVPGQVAKDVGLFLGWIEGERRARGGAGAGAGEGQTEEVKGVGEH